VNQRTSQRVPLSADHVHHFTSSQPASGFDGFLELTVRIDITSDQPSIKIIVCIGSEHRIAGHIHDLDNIGSFHSVALEFRDGAV